LIKKLNTKQILSLVLALVLMVGSFSVSAFAYEREETDDFFSESPLDLYPVNDEQLQDEIADELNEERNTPEEQGEPEDDMQAEEIPEGDEIFTNFTYGA